MRRNPAHPAREKEHNLTKSAKSRLGVHPQGTQGSIVSAENRSPGSVCRHRYQFPILLTQSRGASTARLPPPEPRFWVPPPPHLLGTQKVPAILQLPIPRWSPRGVPLTTDLFAPTGPRALPATTVDFASVPHAPPVILRGASWGAVASSGYARGNEGALTQFAADVILYRPNPGRPSRVVTRIPCPYSSYVNPPLHHRAPGAT